MNPAWGTDGMRPAVTADEVAAGAKARGAMTPDDEADEEALDG